MKKARTKRTRKATEEKPRPFDSKAVFLQAFRSKATNVSEACEAAGIGRTAFYEWCKKDPAFAEKVDHERERMLDLTESCLHREILRGDPQLIKFVLRTKGRSRGYVERTELTGANGDDLKIFLRVDPEEVP